MLASLSPLFSSWKFRQELSGFFLFVTKKEVHGVLKFGSKDLPRVPEQSTGGTGGARCTVVQPPARTSGTGTGAPRLPARWYTVRTRTVCAVDAVAWLRAARCPATGPHRASQAAIVCTASLHALADAIDPAAPTDSANQA